MIEVSAPGKLILIGEHSVVYGYPAIISAIDKRTKIKAERAEKIKIKNIIYQREGEFEIDEILLAGKKAKKLWQKGNEKNDFSELFEFLKSNFWKRTQAMLGLILDRLKIKQGFSLTIDSDLPIGVGLGSSASLSVALSGAIAALYDISLSKEEINEIAFGLEKLNHGKPSGGDNSVCTFGGTIWFEKKKIEPISLPDFFQESIIVLTPRKSTTGDLVQKVRNLPPNFRNKIMENLGEIAFEMKRAFENKNFEKTKNLINLAQDNLAKLGISNPKIDKLVNEIRKIGGAAKISGGGGGTVLCFHQNKKELVSLLKKTKANFQEVKLEAEGVKVYA